MKKNVNNVPAKALKVNGLHKPCLHLLGNKSKLNGTLMGSTNVPVNVTALFQSLSLSPTLAGSFTASEVHKTQLAHFFTHRLKIQEKE